MDKYLSKVSTETQSQYLDLLNIHSFQRVSRLFVLSFENEIDWTERTGHYPPNVEIKDYNVKIDGRNFFNQPIENNTKTKENTEKNATGQEIMTQLAVY